MTDAHGVRPWRAAGVAALAATGFLLWLVAAGCQRIEEPVPAPPLQIQNPYAAEGSWWKCNFHMHTRRSDGQMSGQDAAAAYGAAGYAALCIADHNRFGDQDGGALPKFQLDSLVHDWNGDGVLHPEWSLGSGVEAYVRDWNLPGPAWSHDAWSRPPDAPASELPLLIPGFEASYSYLGAHFVLVGYPAGAVPAPEPGFGFLDRMNARGFAIVAHPGLANASAREFADAVPLGRFHGVEILNGLFLTAGLAHADATPFWDAILTAGYRLWGIGNDDEHQDPTDPESAFGSVFTMVKARERTAESFLSALHAGACYVSTGLLFDDIRLVREHVVVRVPGAQSIRFIARGGHYVLEVAGENAAYPLRGDEGYVRVEAIGTGGDGSSPRALSQPFFILEPSRSR